MSRSALHHAVEKGHAEMVQLLLESGAEVNRGDDFGQTALHRAFASEDVTRTLLAAKDIQVIVCLFI